MSAISGYKSRCADFLATCRTPEFLPESKRLIRFSAPICLQLILLSSSSLTSVFFTGYFLPENQAAIGAIGMGVLIVNAFGRSLIVGSLGGFTTLAPQAYGAGNYERITHLLQRTLVMQGVLLVFIVIAWSLMDKLLIAAGQPLELSELTFKFVLARIPAIPFFAAVNSLLRWLQVQNIVQPTLWYGVCYLVLTLIFIPLLYSTGWGFVACPSGITVAEILTSIIIVSVCYFKKLGHDTFTGFTKSALTHGWFELLATTLPSGAGLWFEWAGTEVQVFLAGLLGTAASSVQTACLQLVLFFFSVPLGFGMGVTNKIGHHLGAGDHQKAKLASCSSMIVGSIPMVIGAIIIVAFQFFWVPLTLQTERTADMEHHIIGLVFLFTILYGMAIVYLCILRAMGFVLSGFVIMFVGQYFLSLPVSVLAAFTAKTGVLGLWLGMNLGMLFATGAMAFIITTTNWEKLAKSVTQTAKRGDDTELVEVREDTPLLHHRAEATPKVAHSADKDKKDTHPTVTIASYEGATK